MLAVMHVCCLLLFAFACCAVPCILAAVPSVHKVQALPGLPALAEAQFTGYLPTGAEDASPQLFYWLMQSRRSPDKDALVLWLQGGPGCSGGLGLFWELGPYRVHEDKQTLYKNADAWNSIANVLMIDQPAGTGFSSVADNSSIPVTLAASTKQLHFAINAFLDAFPEFKGRGMPAPPLCDTLRIQPPPFCDTLCDTLHIQCTHGLPFTPHFSPHAPLFTPFPQISGSLARATRASTSPTLLLI
jgi:hypothetical protein